MGIAVLAAELRSTGTAGSGARENTRWARATRSVGTAGTSAGGTQRSGESGREATLLGHDGTDKGGDDERVLHCEVWLREKVVSLVVSSFDSISRPA